jgi:hypothetical protein
MSKYKFREVGTTRHPEIYTGQEVMIEPVFDTVEKELEMWKAAEKISKSLAKFTIPQKYFIWHYVNALGGISTLEELKWMEWLRFRAYYARMGNIKQLIEETGVKQ